MVEPIAYLIVALFAVGMAGSFLVADPRSPTSRALSALFAFLGIAFLMNIPAQARLFFTSRLSWTRCFSLIEIGVIASLFEWSLRVGRTQALPQADRRYSERLVRIGQAAALVYGAAGALLPAARAAVWNVAPHPRLLFEPAYYVFAAPFAVTIVIGAMLLVRLLRAELDPAERLRAVALYSAGPFWAAGMFLPWNWIPVSFAIGELIFLIGAIRYHVLQGQRGQFLARFLSPQLTRLVRERGLASALEQRRV
ncbi:MAG: adenylate/guanylate cyclase domain-containing protein, partial [Candidatus Binatia bacterium]